MQKILNSKNIYKFVFVTFILSAIYVSVRILLVPSTYIAEGAFRVKSEYVMLLLQCLAGIVALLVPGILYKKTKLNIPSRMLLIFALFLYCSIYLGDIRSFYYRVPHWDTVLHTFSGIALGALGFSVISLLHKSAKVQMSLSPALMAMFAFCFAVSLGVIWEIYEFTLDYLLNSDMQQYLDPLTKQPLVGQAALIDTMKDLIVDTIGAFAISIIGYISLKYKKGWLDKFLVKL